MFAVLEFCRRYPLGAVGGLILFIMVFFAIFANVMATRDPVSTNTDKVLLPPGTEYLMGTDYLGRDLYARIVHGARISLIVGLCSTLLGGSVGMVIGLLSGYLLGWWDLVTQRLMDIMQGLPLLVMAAVRIVDETGSITAAAEAVEAST